MSYSSASTTNSSSPPMRALPPHAATRPPASPVGFRPAAVSASVTMTVVVVLPCVPATATLALPAATSSPKASARRTTGSSKARARSSSGWSRGTAAVTITARAPSTWLGSWPRQTRTPRVVRSSSAAPEVSESQPVMATPRCLAITARALIPAPAMPMKWMGRGSPVRNKVICGQLIYEIYATCESSKTFSMMFRAACG